MTEISTFGSSLLANNDVNLSNPTPVIKIYPRAYGQQDEFVPSVPNNESKKGVNWFSVGTTLVGALGLFIAGKKGLFGKKIQTWFGGRMSENKLFENIEKKMFEFADRNADRVISSKIVKEADGTSVLRTEFENGIIKDYQIKETDNVLKLFGTNEQGLEEVILFNKTNGAVKYRTVIARDDYGKLKAYASYKGEDVLDKDFNEVTGIYRDYWKKSPSRRYLMFGPQEVKSEVRTFTNAITGKPEVKSIKKVYKHGNLAKIHQDSDKLRRTFLYDDAGNLLKVVDKPINS